MGVYGYNQEYALNVMFGFAGSGAYVFKNCLVTREVFSHSGLLGFMNLGLFWECFGVIRLNDNIIGLSLVSSVRVLGDMTTVIGFSSGGSFEVGFKL